MLALMLAAQAAAGPASPIEMNFTPREAYVSCSLVLSGDNLAQPKLLDKFKPTAPATCLVSEIQLLGTAKKEAPGSALRFCPDGAADFDSNMPQAMSLAYVTFYEEHAADLNKMSGLAALLLSFKSKWPCS